MGFIDGVGLTTISMIIKEVRMVNETNQERMNLMPSGNLLFLIGAIGVCIWIFMVLWAIYQIIGIIRTQNKSGRVVFSFLTFFYGTLTLVKVFTVVVNDEVRGVFNFVLKSSFTFFNNLYRMASITDGMMGPDGPAASLMKAGKWYLQGRYIHIANLTQTQVKWYGSVIDFWLISTLILIPLCYLWFEKSAKKNKQN